VIYNGVHMYLGQSAVGGFGPWRQAIDKVEALGPRHIVCGHQDKRLDDDAKRTIEQTRQYLDDSDDLLCTENTAVGYFNAKIERYPDHLGRLILWVTARALYGVREHPERTPPRSPSAPGSDPRQLDLGPARGNLRPQPGSPTRSTWPVRRWPWSLSRHAMTSATRSGVHGRPASSDTALTVMLRSRSSSASARVSASVMALVAA